MILAGATFLSKCVIEFGSKRQFAKEVAEGGFIKHIFLPPRHREHGDLNFLCVSVTLWLIKFFYFPIQARADGALADLGPLGAGRA